MHILIRKKQKRHKIAHWQEKAGEKHEVAPPDSEGRWSPAFVRHVERVSGVLVTTTAPRTAYVLFILCLVILIIFYG